MLCPRRVPDSAAPGRSAAALGVARMGFQFRCAICNDVHRGVPTFGFDAPAIAKQIPEAERDKRVALGTDDCIVDRERFLVRGCLEIPVDGESSPFVWVVWVEISRSDFERWSDAFYLEKRDDIGPFTGYLGSVLPCYPDTFNLSVLLYLRNNGVRPLVQVSQSSHPLHAEQRNGISHDRLAEIYAAALHGAAEPRTRKHGE